eukprot:362754-Chlamydomonas_euryale.AAC.22
MGCPFWDTYGVPVVGHAWGAHCGARMGCPLWDTHGVPVVGHASGAHCGARMGCPLWGSHSGVRTRWPLWDTHGVLLILMARALSDTRSQHDDRPACLPGQGEASTHASMPARPR